MAIISVINSKTIPENKRIDAEYFQPRYLDFYRKINDWDNLGNLIDPPLNGDDIRDYKDEGEMYYIRTGDINSEGLHLDKIKKITRRDDLKIKIKEKDVLFTRKGNYGKSVVVSDWILNSAISSEIMLLRVKDKKLSPYFLNTFLRTKYGQIQIERNIHGVSNFSITQDDVTQIKIKLLPRIFSQVKELIKQGDKQKFSVDRFYKEVEQEILNRIEWDKVKMNHVLSYVTTSKDIVDNERFNPEFYQPKFENLEKHLRKIGAMKINSICNFVNHGIQPPYFENGKIAVITQKEMTPTFLELKSVKDFTNEDFYNENVDFQLQKQDVLLYSVGAYIGRCNILLDKIRAMAGSFVTILRTNRKIILPEYLSLFLNSKAGVMQSKQRMRGTAQHYLYPRDIKKILVFIPRDKNGKSDLAWQKKLADKIILANEAKKSAKQKLQEAKDLVEKEIQKIL